MAPVNNGARTKLKQSMLTFFYAGFLLDLFSRFADFIARIANKEIRRIKATISQLKVLNKFTYAATGGH